MDGMEIQLVMLKQGARVEEHVKNQAAKVDKAEEAQDFLEWVSKNLSKSSGTCDTLCATMLLDANRNPLVEVKVQEGQKPNQQLILV